MDQAQISRFENADESRAMELRTVALIANALAVPAWVMFLPLPPSYDELAFLSGGRITK